MTDTPTINAEPKNDEKFKVNDRVRIKTGSCRTSPQQANKIKELEGVVGVIEKAFPRPHCPYKIAGMTEWLYEDELELVHNLIQSKEIPPLYVERKTHVTTYVRPVVDYFDFKEVAQ